MPPVVAFITTIGTIFGFAGTAATIAGAAIIAGTAVIAKALMPKIDMGVVDTDRARQTTVRSTIEPRKLVYGETMISGVVSFAQVNGANNKNLHQVISIAGHKLTSIDKIFLDDYSIDLATQVDGNGDVTSGKFRKKTNESGTLETMVHIETRDGSSTQTAYSNLVTAFAGTGANAGKGYESTHRGDNVASIYTRWTIHEGSSETWDEVGGIQNIKAVVKGKAVYDPRLDVAAGNDAGDNPTTAAYIKYSDGATTATHQRDLQGQNPALMIADYLMDSTFGLGLPASKIDWSAVITAADACDFLVPIPVSQTQKRFFGSGVIFGSDNHRKSISKILSGMNGDLIYSQGKYIIKAGIHQAATSDLAFTEDDIAGEFTVKTSIPRADRFNTIKGMFIDPESKYKMTEFSPRTVSGAVARDNGEVLEQEIKLTFTSDRYVAQRLAIKKVNQSFLQTTLSLPVNLKGMKVAVGDRITLALNDFATIDTDWNPSKEFKVVGWSFSESGNGAIDLSLIEDDSARYADPAEGEYNQISNTGVITTSLADVPLPTGFTATAGYNSVNLAWTNPTNIGTWEQIWIYASDTTTPPTTPIEKFRGTAFTHQIAGGTAQYYWIQAVKYPLGATPASGSTNTSKSALVPFGAPTAVTALKIANAVMASDSIDTAQIIDDAVGSAQIAQTLQSDNYSVQNETGWEITKSGDATFNNAVVRGNISATTGSVGGFTISSTDLIAGDGATRVSLSTDDGISLGNNTFASAPFRVTRAGALTATSGSIGNTVTVGGTAASTVASGAAAGATASQVNAGLALLLNKDTFGNTNSGEAALVSIDKDGVPILETSSITSNGFIQWNGSKITVEAVQYTSTATVKFTVLTSLAGKRGFIVFDTTKSNPFTVASVAMDVAFAYKEGNQWYYDNNGSAVTFTPTNDMVALGYLETSAADTILKGGLINPVTLTAAAFPSDEIKSGSIGGININTSAIYSGSKSSFADTDQGFWIGSNGTMSFANGTANTLEFDTNGDLSVTGDITATSGTFTGTVNASAGAFTGDVSTDSKFIAGSGDATTVIDGAASATYRIFSGAAQAESENAPFQVKPDGSVFAKNITVFDSSGNILLNKDGLGAAALAGISLTSGTAVDKVSGVLSGDGGEMTLTLDQTATVTLETKFAIYDNSGGTLYFYGAGSTEAAAKSDITNSTLNIIYSLQTDGGSYSTAATKPVTFTSTDSTPSSTEIYVTAVYIAGSIQEYRSILMDAGGALEYIANTSTYGATAYVVTSHTFTNLPAGVHKVKLSSTITGSGSPAAAGQSTSNRLYELRSSGINFVESAANVFANGTPSVPTGGGTVSGSLIVTGDLTVNGTTTTVNTDNLTVKDNNITLNYSTGDSSSTANNSGITIQDAVNSTTDASLLWKTASDTFEFSHGASINGRLTTDSVTIDDDGSGSPLLKIQADDSSPWAIQFENSAFVSPNTGNLRGYLSHGNGFFYWMHQKDFGDDSYPSTVFQFNNGTTTHVGLSLTATAASFGGAIVAAGNISISKTVPILIINDTDATTPTNQVAYISFQRQGTEKAWIGYGGSGDDTFKIRNTEGPITINGPTDSLNLDVLGNVRLGQSTVNTFMYINGGETSTGAQDREAGIIWQKGGSQKWETYVESGSNHYYKFYSYTDSQEVLQLRNDGDVQAPNGQFIAENFMFEGVSGKIRFGGTGDDGDYLLLGDVSSGSNSFALVQDSATKISVDGVTGNFGVLTATPKATIDVAQSGNDWEDGILIRHNAGDTGWNIHAEDNTANELWFGYNANTSLALTSQTATNLMQLSSLGYVKITGASDYQLALSGGTSSWAGIKFSDTDSNDNFWYKGLTSTFAIGGGGSTAVGKKLHVDGRTSIGDGFDDLTTASQLYVYESADSPSGTSGTLSSVISVAARTDAAGDGAAVDFVSVWGGADLYQHTAVNAGWVTARVGGIYDSGAGNGGALVFYTNSGTSATSGSTYANLTEKMRIKPNGEIHVGGTKVIDQARNATFTSLTTPVLDGNLVYLTNSGTPTGARFQIDVEGVASQQALYTYWYDGTSYNARTSIGGNDGNYFNVLGQFKVGGVDTIGSDRRGYFSSLTSISGASHAILVLNDTGATSAATSSTYLSFQHNGTEFSWLGHYDSASVDNSWLYLSAPDRVYFYNGAYYHYRKNYSASNRGVIINNIGSAEAEYNGVSYDSVVIAQSDVPTIRLRETLNAQELTFATGNEHLNASTIGATGRLVFATNRTAGESGYTTAGAAMVIDTSGNVGIGLGLSSGVAVNPSFTLDVERDTDTWVSRIYNTGSDADAQGLLVRSDATSAHGATVFAVYANSAYKMRVKSSGVTDFNLGGVTVNADNTINWGTDRGRLTWDGTHAYVRGLQDHGLILGGNNTTAITIDAVSGTTATFANTTYWSSVGIVSWGSGGFALGNSYGMRAQSGYALSLGSNGTWDRFTIDTSGNVYENSNRLRGYRTGALTAAANVNYPVGWYRVAATPIQAGGYGARSAFKVRIYTAGGYFGPGTLEAKCFKNWADLLHISSVETSGSQYFTKVRLVADVNTAYFEVYLASAINIAGASTFQVEVSMEGLSSGQVLPYTETLVAGLSSPTYTYEMETRNYSPALAVANLLVRDDLYLPSGGIIYFNGQTSAGNGNYNINGNSGYFDTLNSGYDSDPLELCYIRGSHVTIGTGTYGSKHIRATEGVFTSASDSQLQLRGTDTWAGIKFADNVNSTPREEYLWYNGQNKTFAFGGGGSNVANKKLHVDGGMTVGAGYDTTTLVANQIRSQGGLQSDNAIQINYTGNGNNGTDACLHILHNSADWKIKTEGKVGSTYYDYGYINSGAGSYAYYQTNSGTVSARIDYAGNAIFSGNVTAYGAPSDLRLKENIDVIENALDKVTKLRGVTFNYKKDGSRSTGLIAQELLEVLPEAVYEPEELNPDDEKFYAVRYGNTVGLLVEAIKELKAENDELKAMMQKILDKEK